MKLLVFTDYWPTEINPIAGIFVYKQVEELAINHQVTVITARPSTSKFIKCENVTLLNIPIMFIPFKLSFNIKTLAKLIEYINVSRLIRKVGFFLRGHSGSLIVVHGHRVMGRVLTRLKHDDSKKVLFCHGEDKQFEKLGIKVDWNKYEKIVSVGATLIPHMKDLGMKQIQVIHNGTDITREFLPSQKYKNHLNLTTIANLNQNKNLITVIKTLNEIKNKFQNYTFTYNIIGDGPEMGALSNAVKDMGMSSEIFFHGRLSHSETLKYLESSNVFVLVSYKESFGVVYIEAMAYSNVVIGSKGTGAEEIINSPECGFLVRNSSELTNAIVNLMEKDNLDSMAFSAYKRAKHFSWKSNVEKLIAIFNSI